MPKRWPRTAGCIRRSAGLAVAALSLSACLARQIQYYPYSTAAKTAQQHVPRALEVLPGDVPMLKAAGAHILGTIVVQTPFLNDKYLAQDVSELAAKRGATHYMLATADAVRESFPVFGVSTSYSSTQVIGNTAYSSGTTYTAPAGTGEAQTGTVYRYVTIAVDDVRTLPIEMRPQARLP